MLHTPEEDSRKVSEPGSLLNTSVLQRVLLQEGPALGKERESSEPGLLNKVSDQTGEMLF